MGVRRVWTGNEACAEAAIAAGMRFFAGYPITPASEIAEVLARRLPEVGGSFIQMEDEIASIGAVIGASMAGAKSMTATSGPGFSLMQENLGFAAMAEVPCVVVDVQRVGPSSGVATHPAQGDVMQARWGTHGDHPVVALAPWSSRETYDVTVKAFNISERFRLPVVILSDAMVGHMSEDMEVPGSLEIVERPRPGVPPEEYQPYRAAGDGVPPMASFGDGYTWYTTGIVHDDTGFPCTGHPPTIDRAIRRLNSKVTEDVAMYEEYWLEDAEAVIVAYGSVARWALAAVKGLRAEGCRVGLFRPVILWPFPARELAGALGRAALAVVPEMNLGQILGEVERAAPKDVRVVGVNRVDSRMISIQEIAGVVKEACSS
ncbi:MAG: 2-oxoacid:acceptor oxidoreductase subunit alpha [Bacillota bacterium]|jgi:2-oxoglutarate ferredoxin oxidoreductase subunit alpha